jgi:AcrR family transcriptional regulator
MATRTDRATVRETLTRARVVRAAIDLADRDGVESLSMRRLGQALGVVPMAIYKHVSNKDAMFDGMVDAVVEEINDAVGGRGVDVRPQDWRSVMRRRVLSARQVLLRHPWAPRLMESRTGLSSAAVRYFDSLVELFQKGGFSIDLTHHALHAMGSRALGFTQELYDDSQEMDADATAMFLEQMAGEYPHFTGMVTAISHDADTTLGWCDDQAEFEFALDLILDGLERLRDRGEPRA